MAPCWTACVSPASTSPRTASSCARPRARSAGSRRVIAAAMTISSLAASFRDGAAADLPDYALGVARSFSGRGWRLRAHDAELTRQLELKGLSPTLARVLAARGVAVADADNFLAPKIKTFLPNPLA